MMKELTLDTFNEILFSAFKTSAQSDENYLELLQMELQMAYSVKIQHMEELVDALNKGLPYHNSLRAVNAVDSNCDVLNEKIKAQREKTGLPAEDNAD